MLVGILCDVVSNAAQDQKDSVFMAGVEAEIEKMALLVDTDNSGMISKEEFESLFVDKHMAPEIAELGVDVVGLINFAGFVFAEYQEIPYEAFQQMVVKFRGDTSARIKDIELMKIHMVEEIGRKHDEVLSAVAATTQQIHRHVLDEANGSA